MQWPERSFLNIIQLGIGMMLVFFAFISQAFIVETVLENRHETDPRIAKHAGYYSQTIIYSTFLVGNLLAPPIISFLGRRLSIIFGSFPYVLYMAGFLFLNPYYLYASAAFEGFMGGLLWTSVGLYVAENSNERTISRNSNVFWMLYMSCMVLGGIYLLVVFGQKPDKNISMSTTRILYGTFAAVALVGVVVLGLLQQKSTGKKAAAVSHRMELMKTVRMLGTVDQWLIAIPSAFTGIENSFFSGVYSTALSFTKAFTINTNQLMAYNSIATGVGQLSGGLLFALLGKWSSRVGRWYTMWMGTAASLICYTLVALNLPGVASFEKTYDKPIFGSPSIAIALICGILLGFSDCCVNTQIYALISVRYHGRTGPAFALSKFWHALFTAICMFYGSVASLYVQLAILAVGTVISSIAYTIAERKMLILRKRAPTIVIDDCIY